MKRVFQLGNIFYFILTATTEIYTLSLHDALPIYLLPLPRRQQVEDRLPTLLRQLGDRVGGDPRLDRKSTRLNSSHVRISYAVFCLKKKTKLYRKVLFSAKTSVHIPRHCRQTRNQS